MRLFHVLPILSLLFGAHAFSLDSRQSNAHPLDARDFSDVCAILDPSPTDLYLYASFWGSNVYGQFDAPFFLNDFKRPQCDNNVDRFLPLFVSSLPTPGG